MENEIEKILIVEDDENKQLQIQSFIEKKFPLVKIDIAKSLHSAIKIIRTKKYDLVLLDMTLPTFDYSVDEDGGRTRIYGGREFLRQIDRLDMKLPTILITSFDRFGKGRDLLTLEELDRQLEREHELNYRGVVYYNATYDNWKKELLDKCISLK